MYHNDVNYIHIHIMAIKSTNEIEKYLYLISINPHYLSTCTIIYEHSFI